MWDLRALVWGQYSVYKTQPTTQAKGGKPVVWREQRSVEAVTSDSGLIQLSFFYQSFLSCTSVSSKSVTILSFGFNDVLNGAMNCTDGRPQWTDGCAEPVLGMNKSENLTFGKIFARRHGMLTMSLLVCFRSPDSETFQHCWPPVVGRSATRNPTCIIQDNTCHIDGLTKCWEIF